LKENSDIIVETLENLKLEMLSMLPEKVSKMRFQDFLNWYAADNKLFELFQSHTKSIGK